MVPVASAITSLFLDEVAQAVEDKHYPHLPQVRSVPFGEAMRDTENFLDVLVGANFLALFLYVLFFIRGTVNLLDAEWFLIGPRKFYLGRNATCWAQSGQGHAQATQRHYLDGRNIDGDTAVYSVPQPDYSNLRCSNLYPSVSPYFSVSSLKNSISLICTFSDKMIAEIMPHATKAIAVVMIAFLDRLCTWGEPACVPGSTLPTSP